MNRPDPSKKSAALHETTKKVVTKTVSNVVTTKTKILSKAGMPVHNKLSSRGKAKLKLKEDDSHPRKRPFYPTADGAPTGGGIAGAPSTSYFPGDTAGNGAAVASSPLSSPASAVQVTAVAPPPHHHPNFKVGGKKGVAHGEFPQVVGGGVASANDDSDSSSSSEEEEMPRKMTLSERFGKLAQLSSQRQEYDGVRMKIVREGGQDKKVYLEAGLGSRFVELFQLMLFLF